MFGLKRSDCIRKVTVGVALRDASLGGDLR